MITNLPVDASESLLMKANASIIIAQSETDMKHGLDTYFKIFLKCRNREFTHQINKSIENG